MKGWAIKITRDDGTSFLASGAEGNFPVVWALRNRKYALKFKKELLAYGMRSEIVKVSYTDPEIIA